MRIENEKTMYVCPKCGPFVIVYKEIWTQGTEGPYKIEFLQHIDGRATVIDEVSIKSKPDGEPITFSFCGECKRLIDQEKYSNWLEKQPSPF